MSAEHIPIQLEFWKSKEECEIEALRKAVDAAVESSGKVRRKIFSENAKLTKLILDLQSRLEIIEKNICVGVYECNTKK